LTLFFGSIVVAIIANVVTNTASGGEVVGALVCAVFSGLFIWMFVGATAQGPETTYKAKITDFNVVYEKGYEIIEKDGELYTIRESEAD
jgi:hypothetical protein